MKIKENISLAPYTIYKIGGPAKFFVEVKNSLELKEALRFAAENKEPFFILGAGSNILINDKSFNGLIIHMTNGSLQVSGENLIVDSGVMVARAVLESAKAGLSGFEWGIGIPGTIGGAVRGNAGCFGSETKDIIEEVAIYDTGKTKSCKLKAKSCEFAYRDSIFKKHPEWIILSATFKLKPGDPGVIKEEIKRISMERTSNQDIGTKSCGCIFKNIAWARKDVKPEKLLSDFPELAKFREKPNIPASFLIDQAGLKGRRVGKVFVSPKHANYFINDGGASAEEVLMLIGIVKDVIKRKFGLLLEEEIQYVGF